MRHMISLPFSCSQKSHDDVNRDANHGANQAQIDVHVIIMLLICPTQAGDETNVY